MRILLWTVAIAGWLALVTFALMMLFTHHDPGWMYQRQPWSN